MVYQLAFKTSKHATYDAKMQAYLSNIEDMKRLSDNQNALAYSSLEVRFDGDEAFDPYDLNEYAYSKGSKTDYVAPALLVEARNGAADGASNTYWSWLYHNYYKRGLNDDYIRNTYIATTWNNKPNPGTERVYPSEGAYLPGSRTVHDTRLSEVPFPNWATDLRYQGIGPSTKLTNQEINAVFWKDYVPPSQGSGLAKNLNVQTMKVVKINPNLLPGNMNVQSQSIHKLVLRYDVPAVLIKDRELMADELLNRYNSILAQSSDFVTWAKYNYPAEIAVELGVQNPAYWHMRPGNNTKLYLDFHIRGKNFPINRTITFQP
jgi:hypothetical protein